MPILVVVLGVVIVVLGTVFFMGNDNTPVVDNGAPEETANRPESEQEETVVITEEKKEPEPKATTTPTTITNSEPTTVKPEVTETKPTPTATGLSGTFSEQTDYLTPKRTSHTIDLTLTVKDNVVTDSKIVYDGKFSGFSNKYQENFEKAYKQEVIGKSLETISLSRLGGASLTSDAFNQAVKNIIEQNS